MKIGCFALVEPFTPMSRQFEVIRGMGIDYVDLTDNHDGASHQGEQALRDGGPDSVLLQKQGGLHRGQDCA